MKNRENQIARRIRPRKTLFFVGVVILIVSVLVIAGCFTFYTRYRNQVISNEEKQLQTIADTIGHNVGDYIKTSLNEADLYFDEIWSDAADANPTTVRTEKLSAFLRNNHSLYNGLILQTEDGTVLSFDQLGNRIPYEFSEENLRRYAVEMEAEARQNIDRNAVFAEYESIFPDITFRQDARIVGKARLSGGQGYHMYIQKLFFRGQHQYRLLLAMDLNEIYRRIVAPVRIGNSGYSIVKDQDLTIIMHHAQSQIGLVAYEDRIVLYPDLDLTDLGKWTTYQQSHDNGSQVLHTYDWDTTPPKPITRVIAFTTMKVRGERWIINSTIPLEELQEPLNAMISMLLRIVLIYMFLISAALVFFIRIDFRSREQAQKIQYLQEINRGMETIVQKNEEIRHYQRVQSLGMMASHIAHEFNNYLTPVLLYADLLQNDETLSEDGKEMVTEIASSIDRAAGLSRQLLDFSRQDTGLKLESMNLTEEVENAVRLIRQLCPARIRFDSEITAEEIRALVRKGMMEQILMNLAKNAFQAMEESETPVFSIRFARDEKGIPTLTVSDSGCGIPSQSLDRIFEPFFTTKGSHEGTGLGLSVIRNILQAIGGKISVESTVNVGTTFRITFPEIAEDSSNGGRKRLHAVQNIAIVSPDPKIRAYRNMFTEKGLHVTVSEISAPIIDRISHNPESFDLMLIDYSLPTMSGIDLAEIVRRQNPEIRLIVLVNEIDTDFSWYQNNGIIDRFLIRNDLDRDLESLFSVNATDSAGDS